MKLASAAMTRMQKLRAKMMIHQPFFATMLVRMPMVERTDIPTAATDMESIFINPEFIDSLESDDLATFVIAHELSHRMFLHGIRRQHRNPQGWNIACDYAINLMLKEAGFTIWEHALIDDRFAGMSADQIYEILKQESEKKGGGGAGKIADEHGDAGGMIGDLIEPGDLSPEAQAKIERKVQQAVAQAANVARMAGKIPGGLERFIGEILDPKVPWQVVLRDYMTRLTPDDLESWNRRNRRFEDVFLPSRSGVKMGPIVCIGDTSGSIGNDELIVYASETNAIAEDMKPENITFVWADTRVAGEQTFGDNEFDPSLLKPAGGGGTDMRVPLKHVEQYDPEIVILFTDGYTPWPSEEPPYPLIVCCTTDTNCPVGQVIRL